MPPGRLPREVFQACPTEEEAQGKTQDTLERLCLSAGLGTPQGPPGRAGGSVWGEGSLGISAQTAASATRPRIKRMKMDGWMDGWMLFHMPAHQTLQYITHQISRHSHREESVQLGDLRISLLLFADDVVLLASSDCDLQHALEWFAAKCEAVGMKGRTSKSEAMVL
ncbi:hypothetical protein L3Q82_018734 [Scortum barcoo]|uniref:Uncharacterized protein n=1 Tax=Scortum barcoo TaxID=214431 RepID=A0ACB8VFC0_9TELE|nr:hypothetical protein L3Q82_018734 [Scortum barcoo]